MKPFQVKIVLTSGAILLFVLLFTTNRFTRQKSGRSAVQKNQKSILGMNHFAQLGINNLSKEDTKLHAKLVDGSRENILFYDSLANFWVSKKRPDMASWFIEQKAQKTNSAGDWMEAANRYYYGVRFVSNEEQIQAMYQSAVTCLKNVLDKEPGNNDAKIMLASCYVEGTENPMEGINLLREVEKTDSNNVKLQLAFAFFSVKSNQMPKAISRFEKVLKIDPGYLEAYLHLADIYEQINNTSKAIESLEKYASATPDPFEKKEIEKYIQQLKTK